MTDAQVDEHLQRHPYDHVGFSTTLFSLSAALRLATVVKRHHPGTVTSIGGSGTVFQADQLFAACGSLDIVARGEGERTVVAIAKAIEDGRPPRGIPGTAFAGGGLPEETPADDYIDMDRVPRPALDLLPLHRYRLHPPFGVYPPGQYIESARGCPYGCSFCMLSRKLRERSADLVVDDVIDLRDRYGAREVHFVDPTFTATRDRVLAICEGLIRRKARVHWTCKTRCDVVDREMLTAMAASGCYSISYGVESAEPAILEGFNKGITVEQIETCLRETKRAGIRALAYLMIGAPGETDETVRRTMALMRRCQPDFALYAQIQPEPQGQFGAEVGGRGIFSEEDLIAYYLRDDHSVLKRSSTAGFPAAQVDRWVSRAFADFYFRPRYVLGRLRDLRSTAEFVNLFRAAGVLVGDAMGLNKTVG